MQFVFNDHTLRRSLRRMTTTTPTTIDKGGDNDDDDDNGDDDDDDIDGDIDYEGGANQKRER